MAYEIISFDTLTLSSHLQTPDSQNMGTGNALSSYMQIPGGYFDNYGDNVSPKGIRPIIKSGVLYAPINADLTAQLDALREKIGRRGRLVIKMSDGTIRWQWARLITCDTNAPFEAVSQWMPFLLRWETADQYWRGTVYEDDAWVVGDDTFVLGDGTAEVGESGTAAALTASSGASQSFTVTNNGNITVAAVKVTVGGGTSTLGSITYTNETTGDVWTVSNVIVDGGVKIVDGGTRLVSSAGFDAYDDFYANNSAWPTLVPGENSISVMVGGNASQDATIGWEYFDHYA